MTYSTPKSPSRAHHPPHPLQSTAAPTGDGLIEEGDEPSCVPTIGGIGLTESQQVLSFLDMSGDHEAGRGGDGQEEASERHVLEECAPGEQEERGVHGMSDVAVDADVD